MTTTDNDFWAEAWLDANYSGAPDECSKCYQLGKIIKSKNCTRHL